MEKYEIFSQRFYKYFKYLRLITVISFIIFLCVTAFNTGNEMMYMISYVFMLITFVSLSEAIILYFLYYIFKRKK